MSGESTSDRVASGRRFSPLPEPDSAARDDPWKWADKAVQRWKGLVERRRNHLLELYRSGRWRHYYASEEALARELRDVARGIEDWRGLLSSETAASAATLAPESSPAANEAATLAPESGSETAAGGGVIELPGFIPGDHPLRR